MQGSRSIPARHQPPPPPCQLALCRLWLAAWLTALCLKSRAPLGLHMLSGRQPAVGPAAQLVVQRHAPHLTHQQRSPSSASAENRASFKQLWHGSMPPHTPTHIQRGRPMRHLFPLQQHYLNQPLAAPAQSATQRGLALAVLCSSTKGGAKQPPPLLCWLAPAAASAAASAARHRCHHCCCLMHAFLPCRVCVD